VSAPVPASLRLDPNVVPCGEVAALRVEHVPPRLLGQAVTVRLLEVTEAGEEGEVVAAFSATLAAERDAEGAIAFASATREAVDADVEGDMELPEPAAETSRDGETTVPGTETTWRRAHLRLRLAGLDEEHVVIVRVAEGKDAREREGGVYELGVAVDDAAGAPVFRSGAQVALLDCWEALAENCAAACRNQLEVHRHLVEVRGSGDYYGSTSWEEHKAGKRVTDCVSYVVQVLERAYAELRAGADHRYLHGTEPVTMSGETKDYKRYHLGGLFAPALAELGWALVLAVADPDDLWGYEKTVYRKARRALDAGEEPRLFGRPVTVVAGVGADPPDAGAGALYDALGEEVPFGVVALNLGNHMAMKVGADAYECHWGDDSTSPDLFDREGKDWDGLRRTSMFWLAAPPGAVRAALERAAAADGDPAAGGDPAGDDDPAGDRATGDGASGAAERTP